MAAHHDTRLPGILLLLADGYTQAEIADTLGMTQQGVSQLVKEFRSTA
jgi:predicted transcriptional regulator